MRGGRLGGGQEVNCRPEGRAGENVVIELSQSGAEDHMMEGPERRKEKHLKAFHEVTVESVQPVYAAVHRWPYAQALAPFPETYLWDASRRIGVCGDWFSCGLEGSGRIENACLSGTAMADAIG